MFWFCMFVPKSMVKVLSLSVFVYFTFFKLLFFCWCKCLKQMSFKRFTICQNDVSFTSEICSQAKYDLKIRMTYKGYSWHDAIQCNLVIPGDKVISHCHSVITNNSDFHSFFREILLSILITWQVMQSKQKNKPESRWARMTCYFVAVVDEMS